MYKSHRHVRSSLFRDMMCCPACKGPLEETHTTFFCAKCSKDYPVVDGVVDLYLPGKAVPVPYYDDVDYREGILKLEATHEVYYKKNSMSWRIEEYLKRELIRIVKQKNHPIVDIGCGTGLAFKHIGYPGEIVGLDISKKLLVKAKHNYPQVDVIRCDITRAPIRPGRLKTVFCIATLEHVFHLEDFVEALEALLHKKGRVYAMIPTEGGLAWTILRQAAHFKFAKQLDINYRKVASTEHCNTAAAIDNVLRKFFLVEKVRYLPWRFGGIHPNIAIIYRLKKMRA